MANRTNPQRAIRLLPAGSVAADAADFTVPPEGIEMLLDQVTPRTVSCLFKVSISSHYVFRDCSVISAVSSSVHQFCLPMSVVLVH